MEYFFILIGLLLITVILQKIFRIHLYASKKQAIVIITLFFIIGVVWDTIAISRGHWLFPPEHSSKWIIGKMPIEEYAFMLIQPYFILVVYSILKTKNIKGVE